jgi:hypothetical protein
VVGSGDDACLEAAELRVVDHATLTERVEPLEVVGRTGRAGDGPAGVAQRGHKVGPVITTGHGALRTT